MSTNIKKKLAVLLSALMIVSGAFASAAAPAAAAPVKNGWYQVIDSLSGQDSWYYYENENMKTGWLTDPQDGNWYYLDPETGVMCVGWKKIGDYWYYFGERKYADNRWIQDADGNWKAGTGRHSYGSMYHDEMTPDGYYVGTGGAWKKSSGSSSNGGSTGTRVRAATETVQYAGKEFDPTDLILTLYKNGSAYNTLKLPHDSVTIRKTTVNGRKNGLLRTGSNVVNISFVYCDGDVLQSMNATLTVNTRLDYSSADNWYQTGVDFNENKIDVFYILWTVIFDSVDDYGIPMLNSTLNADDRVIMHDAFYYSQHMYESDQCMFGSDQFNFIAPYYRQLTMSSFSEPSLKFITAAATASRDICDAFDYYWEHQNKGERPFIVAGFSQGGLMTKMLLKHMTEEQYSQMIAAYSMGFQVTPDDLSHPYIKPAQGEDDLGVIISYNSVATPAVIWSQVAGDAAICINPLNWSTGSDEATLTTEFGNTATVHVDQDRHVLIIEGLDNEKYGGQNYDDKKYPMPAGNYHMWEMRFYAQNIRNNAILRAQKFQSRQNE